MIKTDLLTIAAYTADYWQHVCPVIRITAPAQQARVELIQGTNWVNHHLTVFPQRLENADLVIITRDFPRWEADYDQVLEKARALNKKVIYEIDDLLLELPTEHPDYGHYSPSLSGMLKAVIEVDAVVGSTPAICDYLRQFNPNVYLWENYLDDHQWKLVEPRRNTGAPVRLGYMGGHSHSYDLELVAPVLESILRRYGPQVQMVFWGARPPARLQNLDNVSWESIALLSYTDFVEYFQHQNSDIFIAPLQNNLFNHCKSHLKFLEYGALGAPGVYSRITPYEHVIEHEQNGFLAATPEEWEAYLTALIDDPELRYQMGRNAQTTIRQNWLLSKHTQDWKDLYFNLAQKEQPAAPFSDALQVARKMYEFQRVITATAETHLAENKLLHMQLNELDCRLQEKEKDIQEKEKTIEDKDQAVQESNQTALYYNTLYQQVVNSRSWRLVLQLNKLRMRFLPPGSLPSRFLGGSLRTLLALKNHGLSAAIQQMRLEAYALRHSRTTPAPQEAALTPSQTIQTDVFMGGVADGARCSTPAITILVLADAATDAVATRDAAVAWKNAQTIASALQVVMWEASAGTARKLDNQSEPWSAPDFPAVVQGLETPYLCLASADLLRQSATYLEANLFALETEKLAFTVNFLGNADWAAEELNQGKLPCSPVQPLFRIVARKDCVQSDLSLDVGPFLNSRYDASSASDGPTPASSKFPHTIVGKILLHTTNAKDQEGDWQFQEAAEPRLYVTGRHFYVKGESMPEQAFLSQQLLPVHQVMPALPEPSDLPTVIMVMPFLAVGGAEKIALKIMECLADRIRFIVLTFDPLDAGLGTTADQFRQITPYVYMLPDYLNSQLNGSLMVYLIERFDPQTIYIHNGSPWIFDALPYFKRVYPSIRIVNQVYDYQIGWINRYDLSLIMYLDAHIGSNPKICQAYLEKGAAPDQVFFIENGTDPVELNPADYDEARKLAIREQLGLPANTRIVTFASRLNPQKRPLDFIELARRFASDPQVTFLMVGDGPLAQPVKDQVTRSSLKNIVLQPFYQPISDILAITDVLVLPSEFEGMPMIIIETQTMGKPVVATAVGNISEIIERTGGGVIVPQVGDISALMAGVRRMLEQPPEPEELRRTTLRHFDWRVCADKHIPAFFGRDHA